MQQEDCILLIMNCKKYINKALEQKKTWLKNFNDIPFFHVIGDREQLLDKEYLFDLSNNILYVNTLDDYNSLPKKVILAYKAVSKEYNFKYIFKTDDDQMLNNTKFLINLKNLLINKFPRIHYGGNIVNVERPYLSEYHRIHNELPKNLPVLATKYCSGRFYFLSNIAVLDLIKKKNNIDKEYLEDYAIGLNLDRSLKANALNIQVSKYFTDFILTS